MNRIVSEEEIAESELIQTATFSGATKNEKSLPKSINNGAPGGWPTSNLYDVAINSPQSQKLDVGSIVEM